MWRVRRFTTHAVKSFNNQVVAGYKKFLQKVEVSSPFCNKICTWYKLSPKANFFCSKWRKSRIWRESRAILSNQKSVFRQLATTWFDTRQVSTWVVNKAASLFNNLFFQQCCKASCTFFFPFSRSFRDQPLSRGFSLKKWEKPSGRGCSERFESKSHTTGLLRNLLRKCMARHHGFALLCCWLFVAKFESFCF